MCPLQKQSHFPIMSHCRKSIQRLSGMYSLQVAFSVESQLCYIGKKWASEKYKHYQKMKAIYEQNNPLFFSLT